MAATTTYSPPLLLRNPHLQTILPAIWRRVGGFTYERERITTPDGDFFNLDWVRRGNRRLLLVSHGLEGDSNRAYVRGMVQAGLARGFDALAWNFRGCGGIPNLPPRLYHSGADDDLERVINHVLENHPYTEIYLSGFSMGGNVTLVYLGRRGNTIDSRIRAAALISVPGNLAECCRALARLGNRIYMRRFLQQLHAKIRVKQAQFPDLFADRDYYLIKDFHGFKNAEDYWRRCSANRFIPAITLPTLLLNADDDPFFTPACQPRAAAAANPCFRLEIQPHGGHVGFIIFNRQGLYWSEERVFRFFFNNE